MKPLRITGRLTATLAIAAALSPAWSADSAYPQKPIRLVVPWTAGGPVDAVARAVGAGLTQALGQPVVVDNRPGASGTIGGNVAFASPADGYTLFIGNVDTQAVNPQLYSVVRYKADGFDAVAPLGKIPMVLVARTTGDARTDIRSGADLIRRTREKPGEINYGSWGVGSVAHLAFELMQQQADIAVDHIPFQGAAPMLHSLLGGHVDLALAQVPWAQAEVKEGKVAIVGIISAQRTSLAPAIPTLAEQKGFAGYAAEQWVGLFAPRGTSEAIRVRINTEVNRWLATPEGKALVIAAGAEPTGGSMAQLAERQRADYELWGRLIREKKITLDSLR